MTAMIGAGQDKPADREWGRWSMYGAATGWVLALGGLIGTIPSIDGLGWGKALPLVMLCGAPPAAMWMTNRAVAARRCGAMVPAVLLQQTSHGSLDVITDSERRPLRPIGASARDVATRTADLLADLATVPGVRIFHGVRSFGANLPLVSHAISAGRRLFLVESVAWPAGFYIAASDGRILCDGTYIGQSVGPLLTTISRWRKILPTHRVSAVVVVHNAGDARVSLPDAGPRDISWVLADNVVREMRPRVRRAASRSVNMNAMAALVAATAEPNWRRR